MESTDMAVVHSHMKSIAQTMLLLALISFPSRAFIGDGINSCSFPMVISAITTVTGVGLVMLGASNGIKDPMLIAGITTSGVGFLGLVASIVHRFFLKKQSPVSPANSVVAP
jgi:hypothetical protein